MWLKGGFYEGALHVLQMRSGAAKAVQGPVVQPSSAGQEA